MEHIHVMCCTSSACRYDGATQARIFTANTTAPAFVSGFGGSAAGRATGVAMGRGSLDAITPVADNHGDAWVISTDSYYRFRSQGFSRTTTAAQSLSGSSAPAVPLCIGCVSGQSSDWSVAAVLVYRGELTLAQILQVEMYLASLFGFALMFPPPPPPPPLARE